MTPRWRAIRRDPAQSQRTGCQTRHRLASAGEQPQTPNRLCGRARVETRRRWIRTSRPQSSDEFVVGGEYEVLANTRIGATYTRRDLNSVIEDMSRDDGNTYFIGNPGQGFATDFPKPVRNYDAVTLST